MLRYLVLVCGVLLDSPGEQLREDTTARAQSGLQVHPALPHRELQSRGQLPGHTDQTPVERVGRGGGGIVS